MTSLKYSTPYSNNGCGMVEFGDEFLKGGEKVTPRGKKDKRLVELDKAGPSPYLTLSFQAKPYLHTSTL